MDIKLDHIAILTHSLEKAEKHLPQSFIRHEVEMQPAEGTKEQYIELPEKGYPYLLLMEAVADGPYKKALRKRGAGLHHLGCSINDLDKAIHHFAKHGLLLHPISLKTYAHGVAWLCRPGIPFLIELFQSETVSAQQSTTLRLELPAPTMKGNAIEFIPGAAIHQSIDSKMRILFSEQTIPISLSGE